MGETVTAQQLYEALLGLCDTIEVEKEYLSELDGAIGDGDHGVNMAKCFRGVKVKLKEIQPTTAGIVLSTIGMEVMNSVGGAMGALYGTLFIKMASVAGDKIELELSGLNQMFKEGLEGILTIGKAKVGDKTLVDTLTPAVESLEEATEKKVSFSVAMQQFEDAAKQGMESTKNMIAKMGRASRLGERTIGHQDAGATSCFFILQSFAKAIH